MAKTSITLSGCDLRKIREYCKKNDIKISQVFRQGALAIIRNEGD